MKFWSKRNYGIAAILWVVPLFSLIGLIIFLMLKNQLHGKQLIAVAIVGGLAATAFYHWYYTYYQIEDGQLKYQVGAFGGSIQISQIESVQRSAYLTNKVSPAMVLEGLLIRYQGGLRIFVSPADEDGFVQELQKSNSRLRILPKSLQGG